MTDRSCIFCGKGRPTVEHVWPQWLGDALPELKLVRHEKTHESLRAWIGPAFDTRVRRICASCNSGWMSRLESKAKPILTPMIQGRPRVLDEPEQELIALWVIKTVLVFQYAFRPPRVAQDLLHQVFLRQAPPDESRVWLGCYVGPRIAHYYNQPLASHDPGSHPEWVEGYGSTLAIGRFVAQAFGHALDAHGLVREPQELDQHQVPIWPASRRVSWPPPAAFDDNGLEIFQRVFGAPRRQ